MSSDTPAKTPEAPGTGISPSIKAITPPKRFLDCGLYSSSPRRLFQAPSSSSAVTPPPRLLPAPSVAVKSTSTVSATDTEAVLLPPPALLTPTKSSTPPSLKLSPSGEGSTDPPRLIRIPKIVLTPVDADSYRRKEEVCEGGGGGVSDAEGNSPIPVLTLPPPPPLVRMPISTRKDGKRDVAVVDSKAQPADTATTTDNSVKEPPRKRTRLGERTSESSAGGATTPTPGPAPPTPRKIIQEIFGPDKSKKSKGKAKGRKRKKGGASPKKKGQNEEEEADADADIPEQHHDEEDQVEELKVEVETEIALGEEQAEADVPPTIDDDDVIADDAVMDTEEVKSEVGETTEDVEDKLEPEDGVDDEAQSEDDTQSIASSTRRATATQRKNAKGWVYEEIESEEDDAQSVASSTRQRSRRQNVQNKPGDRGDEEVQSEDDTQSIASSRVGSRRKAKQVANEKLKRLSHNEEKDNMEESCTSTKKESGSEKGESGPGAIRSRRSTTEGSSKSGSSTNQEDSESSAGGGGKTYVNRHLAVDRQQANPTPLSLISEDADQDDVKVEGVDTGSVGDFQEHRDSDEDSTYSWKPVRAAAAIALEQVTKKQGSVTGSTGLPGDAESKVAAAAERRARKIMRYKGRNRRTLMFKSSSSKKLIAARNNRYSAQPTILPKVLHDGSYMQPGDIVCVEQDAPSPVYGQIKGILMDHFGEVSVGVRWLEPKTHLYELMDFLPINYSIRYDKPERLIKIEYTSFVMHLNLDYFDGHPSYNSIQKYSIYTRLGKSINSYMNEKESDDDESNLNEEQTSSSQSGTDDKSKEKKKAEDDDNSSDTSQTDCSDMDEAEDASNTMPRNELTELEENEDSKDEEEETIDNDDNTEMNAVDHEVYKDSTEKLEEEEEQEDSAEMLVDQKDKETIPDIDIDSGDKDDLTNTEPAVDVKYDEGETE